MRQKVNTVIISDEMINPEIRRMGLLYRKAFHFKGKQTFLHIQWLFNRLSIFMRSSSIRRTERFIQTKDNSNLRICVCKPLKPKPGAVGVLWLHGGGYGIGLPEQDFIFMRNFFKVASCVIVSPDYRLSTEAPYPAALNDCYGTLLWMKEHADELGIRSDQLFVGGDSAGGGLTAAVTLYARDMGEVKVAFQMPLYPMIDDRMITPSSQNNNAPLWDSNSNKIAWKLYLGDLYGTDNVPIYASPARATDYSGLPPTYTFVGDIEVFCDETKAYIANLKAAGVKAEIDVYPGCFHAFEIMGGKSNIGRAATEKYIEKFKYAASHYFAPQVDKSKTDV